MPALTVGAALLILGSQAQAADATGAPGALEATTTAPTRWICWLGASQQSLACLLNQDARPEATATPTSVATADPSPFARHPAPLDPRLPAVVRSLRLSPQSWRHRTVFIPLHGTAFADSPLGLLAQSVLCGAAPDCRAVMSSEREQSEPRVHALLADANDPLLED